ncbi:hypothetical protein [Chromatium okenii]|uniref:hypothetical protein n=1 Tax=Chromatium okenii TaxID=61644 RepID=UPI0026EDB00B|nr:hypothetical protein [Chromatium okenii]MBV5310361.1 hypothetical protein [Chromatium okenii]
MRPLLSTQSTALLALPVSDASRVIIVGLGTGTDCACPSPLVTLNKPEPTQSTALLVLPMLDASRVIIV